MTRAVATGVASGSSSTRARVRAAARACCAISPRRMPSPAPLEWVVSRSAAHLRDLVAEAESAGPGEYEAVAVAGGDGSVRNALAALAQPEPDPVRCASRSDRATTSHTIWASRAIRSRRSRCSTDGVAAPGGRRTHRLGRHALLLRRLGRPRRGGAGRRPQLRPAALQGAERRGGAVGAVHLSPAPAAHHLAGRDRSRTR